MKPNRNPALWTSAILHLVIFVVLGLATLIEILLPKEQMHVFEMVSEPSPSEDPGQNRAPVESLPDFSLPEVQPLEIPEPVVPNPAPTRKPVEQPVELPEPKETLISYEDFIKENPIRQPKTRKLQPSKPTIKVPTINTEKFGINLQSSLTTTDTGSSSTLTAVEQTALQRYGNELNQRLNRAWIKPENLTGINLVTTVVFEVSSSGRISNIQLRPGSGNTSFDESVKAAFLKVGSGGPTPTGQGHTFTMSFKVMN